MTVAETPTRPAGAARPILAGRRGLAPQIGVYVFVILPLVALVATIPFAWGWGLTWTDVAIAGVFYVASGLGITVGFHRYFTHGSFKAKRPLRIALALAGSLAM
jgi:stearoyl-CoA desaturase (Delta-9 desaturase)